MVDLVIILVLGLIVGGAAAYVYKAKKSGRKCIGCPVDCASGCSGSCEGCSGGCSKRK